MLRPRSVSPKKRNLYFIIIFLLIAGTIFMFYQNYLISYKKAPEVNLINIPDGSIQKETYDEGENNQANFNEEATTTKGTLSGAKQLDTNFGDIILDLSILDNIKFKSLKENIIIQPEKEVGKKNPFERQQINKK